MIEKKLKSTILKLKNFIKIDFSFVLTFVFSIFLKDVKLYFCFVVFIILHEIVHFFVAKKLGYMAREIHLSFFGASLEGLDDFSIIDEIKIILVAPLFNLLIAILCYLSFWFYPESYNYLDIVLISNLTIFMFNFLPIYPLDFGRLILVALTKKYTRKVALEKVKKISILVIFFIFLTCLISIFFSFNIMLGFVSINLINLYFSSTDGTSFKRELFIFHKAKLIEKGLIEKNIYLPINTKLYSLFRFIDDYHYFNFIFLNDRFEKVEILSEADFYKKIGFM